MTIDDYEAAIALWSESEGVRLRDADSREGILKSHLMILPESQLLGAKASELVTSQVRMVDQGEH